MRRELAVVASCTGAMLATAGGAQSLQTPALSAAEQRRVENAHWEMVDARDFLACMVRQRPITARRYLDSVTPGDFGAAASSLGLPGTCPNEVAQAGLRRVRMDVSVERGVVAEIMLREGKRPATPPALPLATSYSNPWAPVSGRNVVVDEMATCVASVEPAGIATLVSTEIDSEAERLAITSLGVSVQKCLTASAKLTANRASLRAALAEALYHRVSASAPASQ